MQPVTSLCWSLTRRLTFQPCPPIINSQGMPKNRKRGIYKPSKSAVGPKRKYYAVRYGRDGFSGVLSSWEECSPYVQGVAGARFKSFPDYDQAATFAGVASSASHPRADNNPGSSQPLFEKRKGKYYAISKGRDGYQGVVASWEECQLYVTGVPGAKYQSFKTYEEAVEYATGRGVESGTNTPPGTFTASPEAAEHTPDVPSVDMTPVPVVPAAPKQQMHLTVYTDGACTNNGRHNGRAGYGVFFGKDSRLNISEPLPGPPTNQRAEMMAVLAAMMTVIENDLVAPGGTLLIKTDSQYTKNGIEKWVAGWKKKKWKTAGGTDVKNKDLWVSLDLTKETLAAKRVSLSLEWVKGHAGDPGNEAADRLAVAGISKIR